MGRPRVTSQFIRTPAASPVSIGTRVMAIIGPGSTSFTIQERIKKTVTKGAGGTDTLGHTATAIIKVGDYIGTTDYVVTTDYTLSAGKINWVAGRGPEKDAYYYITYTYAKASTDYLPYLTDNFNDVITKEGAIELSGTTAITATSYLSAAAQLAFDVGVRQIIVCPVGATVSAAAYKTAYDNLESPISGINPYYIVPLLGALGTSGDFSTAKGTALAHVNKMCSAEFGKERELYTGDKDYVGTGIGVDTFVVEAAALATSRVILNANYNPIRVISVPEGSYSIVLDGCFEAVKLAAYRCTQYVSDPMMNRAQTGAFTGYNTRWSDTDVDTLVDGGLCVSEELAGIIKVVDDITTDTSDEIEIDIATVEARDTLIVGLRQAVEKRYKGARGDNTVSSHLKSFTATYLEQRMGEGLIAGVGSVSANRQTGSLRKWEISFSYLPVTKVRDILIRFSIDLGLAA